MERLHERFKQTEKALNTFKELAEIKEPTAVEIRSFAHQAYQSTNGAEIHSFVHSSDFPRRETPVNWVPLYINPPESMKAAEGANLVKTGRSNYPTRLPSPQSAAKPTWIQENYKSDRYAPFWALPHSEQAHLVLLRWTQIFWHPLLKYHGIP